MNSQNAKTEEEQIAEIKTEMDKLPVEELKSVMQEYLSQVVIDSETGRATARTNLHMMNLYRIARDLRPENSEAAAEARRVLRDYKERILR